MLRYPTPSTLPVSLDKSNNPPTTRGGIMLTLAEPGSIRGLHRGIMLRMSRVA